MVYLHLDITAQYRFATNDSIQSRHRCAAPSVNTTSLPQGEQDQHFLSLSAGQERQWPCTPLNAASRPCTSEEWAVVGCIKWGPPTNGEVGKHINQLITRGPHIAIGNDNVKCI